MAAIARQKVWVAGDILTASDLNNEFNNILNVATFDFTWSGIQTFNAGSFKLKGGGAGVVTVQYATSATNRTYTIPDSGADTSFVMLAGAQSVSGAKTFAASTLLLGGAGAGVATLTNANTATSRTITIPDPGAAGIIITDAGAQNITGAKTITGSGQINGGTVANGIVLGTSAPSTTTNATSVLNNQLNIYDGTSARIYVPVDKANSGVTNLGLKLSAGAISITGLGNTALAASNAAWVSYPSSTPASWLSQTVTADQTIASGGIKGRWGTTASVAWANDVPLSIGVCSSDNTAANIRFFLARDPTMTTTPSSTNNIGIDGTAPVTASQTNIVLFGSGANTGYNSRPCRIIGACRATCDSSAGGVWTITALDNGDGLMNFYNFGARQYIMPLAQMGAVTGSFLLTNGGTAPIFTTNTYVYWIGMDGSFEGQVYLDGDGGTDGATAVDTRLVTPYTNPNAAVVSASATFQVNPLALGWLAMARFRASVSYVDFLLANISGANLQNTTTTLQHSSFTNGVRTITGSYRFKAF